MRHARPQRADQGTLRRPIPCYHAATMKRTAAGVRRVQRTWHAVRVIAAAFVLFTIAADVVADARCHPSVQAPAATGVSAASSTTDQDPCVTGCVPDCFCCSTLSPSPVAPPVEVSGPTVLVEALAAPQFRPGVHPLPYRPPLTLSLS